MLLYTMDIKEAGREQTMITYICGSMIKYRQFPEAFWEELDNLMKAGDEILLGDSDFDHRVYGRLRNKQYENISSMKTGSVKKRLYFLHLDQVLTPFVTMLGKCDRMIAVWDGESTDAFINILMLLALHKKCRMYNLPTGECVEIDSVDSLRPFVPEREGWNEHDMEDVLRACGFEDQMVSFMLENYKFHETFITEIVNRAPVPLKKKLEIYENLIKKNNLNHEAFMKVSDLIGKGADLELVKQAVEDAFGGSGNYLSQCISKINSAQDALKYGKYYLFAEWYDTDVFIEKLYPVGLFDSFKKAMEYIRRKEEFENEEWPDDEPLYEEWYRLEAWSDDVGNWGSDPVHTYDFYIFKGEICWFEKLREEKEKHGFSYYMPVDKEFFAGSLDLSFATPFKPGDIVNIDCRPFGPPFNALVIEGRHQYDCCFPQVLFKNPYTDYWQLTSLKHKRFYKDAELTNYEPPLSPLYRLRSVREDELTEDDEILVKISKELNGDEEKGSKFWNVFHHGASEGVSAEEVLKTWEKVKEADGNE